MTIPWVLIRTGTALSVIVLSLVAATGCGGGDVEQPEEAKLEVYDMRGEVVRLLPADKIAVVKHEDIKGWMKAMTMEFVVKDEAEFQKLKEGANIEAKVYVQDLDYWIGDIKVSDAAGAPPPS